MKQLTVLILITLLFSCNGKQAGHTDIQSIYELSIREIIEYGNYYDFKPYDTLLVGSEVTYFRGGQLRERERWFFEYDENNRLIKETHFLHKNDSMELIYVKEFGDRTEKEISIEDGDTLHFYQYKYDTNGNLINHKAKFRMAYAHRNEEYFDYVYDDQNRLMQGKIIDYESNELRISQYSYEMSKDTLISYGFLNGNLTSVEKSITTKDADGDETIEEIYSYDLPDYVLARYEKKILIDDDNYLQVIRDNPFIDSVVVFMGKKIKSVEHTPEMYTMYLYEYDYFGNLKKETVYSKVIQPQTE